MQSRSILTAVVLTTGLAAIGLVQTHARGPVPIFNGKDLTGWKVINGSRRPTRSRTACWSARPSPTLPNSFLATERTYGTSSSTSR